MEKKLNTKDELIVELRKENNRFKTENRKLKFENNDLKGSMTDNILVSAIAIIAFVLVFSQLIKKSKKVDSKWLQLLNLLTGLFLGIAWSLSFASDKMIVLFWVA
ncbi:hypothetical protein [Enterococcus termitis]|uniref:Uncharacterized protein n=1 Tax=Enterococcus termitis TaxID=332950 RepID=A0A1E5GSV3_9ENTE|nr:hypothetical protein [Enterococcus termitis]OEG15769.1 hypothetical protein BCR25_18655 [Enterococcus termitis]OJG96654.1 hypothetical protein RV18_GL002020 [Enterococcus termitis]